jgi:hypothetical protein
MAKYDCSVAHSAHFIEGSLAHCAKMAQKHIEPHRKEEGTAYLSLKQAMSPLALRA